MLINSVAFFLGVSLLFYCLFAGADFGGGILEALTGRRRREDQIELINRAISPVWEANHVWLILAVVIVFVGFPKAYADISVTFHIPLTIMLLGIVLRGCAFTFRNYDAVVDSSQKYYNAIFIVSSFITPFMLGTIAGGLLLGRRPPLNEGFYAAFVSPWANVFSFSIGVFTCVLFAYLAAVYLIGETKDGELQQIFGRRARLLSGVALVVGALVFVTSEISGSELNVLFAESFVSLGAMLVATILFLPLFRMIRLRRLQLARLMVAAQVGLILIGWFALQFPDIINSPHPTSIYNSAAPEATLRSLLYALLVGSTLIFPALIYLFRIFKRTEV